MLTGRRLPYLTVATVAAAVRLPDVWRAALTQDEVFSARIIREPTVGAVVRHVIRTESTPPLWYVAGWLVHRAGTPVLDVRLLSVVFGAALAVVVLQLAAEVLPGGAAFAAALLTALAYQPVVHGSQLRSYELLALLAAVLALLLVRAARSPSRRLDVALATTVWAGLLTHYFFVFSVAAALAWLWLDPQVRAIRRRTTLAVVSGGAAAATWLPGFAVQYRHDHYWWIPRFSARIVLETPVRMFTPVGAQHAAAAVALLALLAAGASVLARVSAAGRLLVVLAAGPIVAAAALWAGGLRIYAVRNLIEVAPFLAVAAAGALSALGRATAPATAAAVAAAGLVCVSVVASPPPQYGAIARELVAEGWRPADPIAVYGNFFSYRAPLEWYLPHAPLLDVSQPTREACPAVFLVSRRRDGSFDVDRLSGIRPRIRHATLLAALHGARCVRLSRDPRLRPLA